MLCSKLNLQNIIWEVGYYSWSPFYVLLSSTMLYLIWKVKRVGVAGRFQGHVKALVFIVICSISVMFDKLVPGKSDALSIIS